MRDSRHSIAPNDSPVGPWGVHFELGYLQNHRDGIARLAQWTHDHWAVVTPRFTLAVEDHIKRLEARAHVGQIPTGFVALVDGQVIGLACLVEHDMNTRMHLSPWLATVFVGPGFRGQGIGAALSERATNEAARLGHPRLFLVTYDQEDFYARLGWSVLERTTYREYPMTIMTQDLTALMQSGEGTR